MFPWHPCNNSNSNSNNRIPDRVPSLPEDDISPEMMQQFLESSFYSLHESACQQDIYNAIRPSMGSRTQVSRSQQMTSSEEKVQQVAKSSRAQKQQNPKLQKGETVSEEKRIEDLAKKIEEETLVNDLLEQVSALSAKLEQTEGKVKERDLMIEFQMEKILSQKRDSADLRISDEFSRQMERMNEEVKRRDVTIESQMEIIADQLKSLKAQEEMMASQLTSIESQKEVIATQKDIISFHERRNADQLKQLEAQKAFYAKISDGVTHIIEELFTCPIDYERFTKNAFVTPSGNTYNDDKEQTLRKKIIADKLDPARVPTEENQILPNLLVTKTLPLLEELEAALKEFKESALDK